jgi:hypothetical protein
VTLDKERTITKLIVAIGSVGILVVPHDASAQQETAGPSDAALALPADNVPSRDAFSHDTSGISAEAL